MWWLRIRYRFIWQLTSHSCGIVMVIYLSVQLINLLKMLTACLCKGTSNMIMWDKTSSDLQSTVTSQQLNCHNCDMSLYLCPSVSDVCTLREKRRIVGTLVGCLPRKPRQNVHLGLPLQLMPEEAVLLINKGKLLPSFKHWVPTLKQNSQMEWEKYKICCGY